MRRSNATLPISPPRPGSGFESKGFTLIEVLVVVLIISVVFTLVVITIPDNKANILETEAERLVTLLTLAKQESIIQARELAIEFSNESYSFLIFQDQKWEAIDDDMFRTRELPEDVYHELYLQGEQFDFSDEDNETKPRVFILSSGEMSPFEVILQHRDSVASYSVSADIGGKLIMSGRE